MSKSQHQAARMAREVTRNIEFGCGAASLDIGAADPWEAEESAHRNLVAAQKKKAKGRVTVEESEEYLDFWRKEAEKDAARKAAALTTEE